MPAAIGYLPKVNLCTRWQHLKVPSTLVKNNNFQVTYEEPGENQLHTPQILDSSLNSCILSTFLPLNDCRQNFQLRKMADHINILIPTGMLGYSFNETLVHTAIEGGIDVIIVDSGPIDSGTAKLALGETTVAREAYERDLES